MFGCICTTSDLELNTFKQQYSIRSKLGKGSFGVVFSVSSKQDKTRYVAKIIKHVNCQDVVKTDEEALPIEIWALRKVKGHPGIISYHEHHLISNSYVIITEDLHGYTDLYNHIACKGRLSEHKTKTIIKQVLSALSHCFKHGIDHRDVKEENIMYQPIVERIKLIDFGSSSLTISAPYHYMRGTEYYIPPEFHTRKCYYPKPAATWAVGCLTYCCLTATTPFLNPSQIIHETVQWSLLRNVQEECMKFVMGCLRKKEGERLGFEGLKCHPWLQHTVTALFIRTTL